MKRPVLVCLALCASTGALAAQSKSGAPQSANVNASKPVPPPVLPKDYVIGVEDLLNVVFWRDKDMSSEVLVRPDGKISLPILNDVQAAGLTPEQLADAVQ